MNILKSLWSHMPLLLPFVGTLAAVVFCLWLIDRLLRHREGGGHTERMFGNQITMLVLTIIGLVVVVLALPAEREVRGQLLSLLGVAITAVLALSSTTFAANALAGIMLRAVRNFRPGDFIRVDDQFGRVTVRGLFHTEIQTEDRDLTTLPNFYLISHPVTVVRSSGTIISAQVSLGYDIPQESARQALLQAAQQARLEDAFVQVLDLGDFAVTYRIAGFYAQVSQLLSARSRLREAMLDALHLENIEITSPNFMVQRQQTLTGTTIPKAIGETDGQPETGVEKTPETMIFDKAETAGQIEELREERRELQGDIRQIEDDLKEATDVTRPRLQRGLAFRQRRLAAIDHHLENVQQELKETD